MDMGLACCLLLHVVLERQDGLRFMSMGSLMGRLGKAMNCVGAWIIDPHHIMENRRRNDMTENEKFICEIFMVLIQMCHSMGLV